MQTIKKCVLTKNCLLQIAQHVEEVEINDMEQSMSKYNAICEGAVTYHPITVFL